MNGRYTKAEREHVRRVKSLPCGVCGEGPPAQAHHIRQHRHFITIPLCQRCHDQVPNGPMWRVHKASELDVLNQTIARLYG